MPASGLPMTSFTVPLNFTKLGTRLVFSMVEAIDCDCTDVTANIAMSRHKTYGVRRFIKYLLKVKGTTIEPSRRPAALVSIPYLQLRKVEGESGQKRLRGS